MVKKEIKKNWALVTGGSSGIGMELAKLLAKDGYSLIIVAKPQEELDRAKAWFDENMPKTKIVYHQQDLATQDAAQKLYDFTTQQKYEIDIFCNNAGYGSFGWFHELPIERVKNMLNLIVMTVWELTRLYLKDMVAKDKGRILITSSSGGLMPVPKSAAYSGGKAFSYFYGLAIYQELKEMGSKVTVTVLLPPPTRTGFAKAAGMEKTKTFEGAMAKDPDYVAAAAYKALMKGKRKVIPGAVARIMMKTFSHTARTTRQVILMKIGEMGSK